ncbi:MAG TPA: DNA repair exonuclease [Candidatus Nanoarchaeia archaeon]|nr:DNA repair exonuclease [Candidatus Nanoarchaeia archaeon]
MKFAHMSDVHIGGWKEPKLRELNLMSFKKAIDICINENVAFLLISGDLFNTALPQIEYIKEVSHDLSRLKEHDINVYVIPGSHDFSPSGKTMIDVLDKAGLMENVFKLENGKLSFTIDKTNAKITGIIGQRTGLEREHYKKLDKESLENEKGFKIFMFHTLISELKPDFLEKVDGEGLDSLPKGFDYYAGGHPHFVFNEKIEDYGIITYPGALFPNNFMELERFHHGGFFIVDVNNEVNVKHVPVKFYDVINLNINVDNKTSNEANDIILDELNINVNNKIVTLRIHGVLSNGKLSDIDWKGINNKLIEAYIVLKNTSKLTTKDYEELKIEGGDIEDIENKVIKENLGKIKIINEEVIIHNVLNSLNIEKGEGERNSDFEERIVNNFVKVFNLGEIWK